MAKGWFPLSRSFCVRSHVNFTRVNKIETMYGRSRVNVKVEPRSNFTLTPGLSYIASSSFTRVNFRCVRTEKLRDSENQLSGCVHTTRDSFWCSMYEQLAILFRNQRFSLRYNRAKITFLMCGRRPYPVWLLCRRKSFQVYVSIASAS